MSWVIYTQTCINFFKYWPESILCIWFIDMLYLTAVVSTFYVLYHELEMEMEMELMHYFPRFYVISMYALQLVAFHHCSIRYLCSRQASNGGQPLTNRSSCDVVLPSEVGNCVSTTLVDVQHFFLIQITFIVLLTDRLV